MGGKRTENEYPYEEPSKDKRPYEEPSKDKRPHEGPSKDKRPHEGPSENQQPSEQPSGDGQPGPDLCPTPPTVAELLAGPNPDSLQGEERQRREKEINIGVELIFQRHTLTIVRTVRNGYAYLSEHDMDDMWMTTLSDVIRRAREGNFKAEGSVPGLLTTIMLRRCADLLRSRGREKRWFDEYSKSVELVAEETNASDEDIEVSFRKLTRAVERLPTKQRLVWHGVLDLGCIPSNKELTEHLQKNHPDRELTETGVRRARQEGRNNIRKYLRER